MPDVRQTCQRNHSVTFCRSQVAENSKREEDDDIQITLAPYIQNFLTHSSSRAGCCALCLPVPFERAAHHSWWDPRFDSDILEGQYRCSSFPQVRLRFRYGLLYILVVSLSWLFFFLGLGLEGTASSRWPIICGTLAALAGAVATVLGLTYSEHYEKLSLPFSVVISLVLCMLSLVFVVYSAALDMTPVGHFAFCVEILLLIYTVVPLPLYLCVGIGGAYSVAFECLTFLLRSPAPCLELQMPELSRFYNYGLAVRVILQLCVHAIGFHILIMTHVRMRGTFMKVGQSLLVRKQLEMEKQLKEKMIHSVMPPKVAAWLMSEGGLGEEEIGNGSGEGHRRASSGDIRSLFRPFNMDAMHNVSILFADIVGFTRMSSNKSAEQLVEILNDLFERFDDLCTINGCEKISTLGDCYYCVSGCPEPRPDHATCCVQMGLGMIQAIQKFDAESNEGVNMRVGIHTGTVLCGIVGTKRFKFDVWSNDVTLANRMESTGKPGMVHISDKTRSFLGDAYLLQEDQQVNGIETYFILGRKGDASEKDLSAAASPAASASAPATPAPATSAPATPAPATSTPAPATPAPNSVLFVRTPSPDARRPLMPAIALPASSPGSLSPSLSPFRRDRVYSCHVTTRPHPATSYLAMTPIENKTTSLPSIMDSDAECDADGHETDAARPHFSLMLGKKESARKTLIRRTMSTSPARSSNHSLPNHVIDMNGCGDTNKANESVSLMESTRLEVPTEEFVGVSRCQSVNSRKDSGIRSTSRRSSIQHQLFALNGMAQSDFLNHRVSGYYTSQSSVDAESLNGKLRGRIEADDRMGACFQQLRKQSDLQLIRCVQDNVRSQRSYFVKPPLSGLTLFFRQPELERDYRCNAHRLSEKRSDPPPTLATSRFNTYFDIVISLMVLSAVALALFLLFEPSLTWLLLFAVGVIVQLCAITFCVLLLLWPPTENESGDDRPMSFVDKLVHVVSGWYPWHIFGALLVSLPAASVLSNLCTSAAPVNGMGAGVGVGVGVSVGVVAALWSLNSNYYFSYILFVSIVHFCNFTQLNCWMKSVLATLSGIIFIAVIASQICPPVNTVLSTPAPPNGLSLRVDAGFNPSDGKLSARMALGSAGQTRDNAIFDTSNIPVLERLQAFPLDLLTGKSHRVSENTLQRSKKAVVDVDVDPVPLNRPLPHCLLEEGKDNFHRAEIFVDVILLILLVWFLNREFEISYRLSFHGNAVAARDKARVQSMKDQADWLLHNIIPRHVADQLKNTAKYSENHFQVGIIFASIVNFNEMYDETYLGGREYLRVLNELIGDFDELLNRPEFNNVTKIKTIGSTYMAASGLNPTIRRQNPHPHTHLFQLIDFAVALQKVIDAFNGDLLEFNLILRVGYNHGDVTAGVIGTTKLYYDIWGDAVNIASRMDSTGIAGRVQIGEDCLPVLSQRYEFEPRGSVYVKGKGDMNVFLLKNKRPAENS